MSDYKQCPNGHYYQGDQCPYCKKTQVTGRGNDDINKRETELFGNSANAETQGPYRPTKPIPESETFGAKKTTVLDNNANGGANYTRPQGPSTSSRTVFGDDDGLEAEFHGGDGMQRTFRETRKFVGWLVSYTLDPMGVDFKLYEGRNIIGRDMDCNITVNDNWVSSKHAVLLFRSGKYSITDSQSSHGTFVNESDIELEPYYLQDGDIIRVGQTVFKFRSSL
ncbi:MAG: FHA domain-containing protein [Bacteroidales bacterium]|nr:FHA domain-containing protein [Bacteroidales bacterium]